MAKVNESDERILRKDCTTISSYLQAVRDFVSLDNDNNKKYAYCFRGQAVLDWKLTPSLSRYPVLDDEDTVKRMYGEVLKNYPNEFYRKEIKDLDFNDLAKMQHYGIPTRLLDVSLNPLVAMFFATDVVEKQSQGVVYIFKVLIDPLSYTKKRFVFPENNTNDENECIMIQTSYTNERIKQQDGAFLYASKQEYFDNCDFRKVIIYNSSKKKIREELRGINISHTTLFPELSEFHEYLKEAYNLEIPKK